jgi:hypothetical protein
MNISWKILVWGVLVIVVELIFIEVANRLYYGPPSFRVIRETKVGYAEVRTIYSKLLGYRTEINIGIGWYTIEKYYSRRDAIAGHHKWTGIQYAIQHYKEPTGDDLF